MTEKRDDGFYWVTSERDSAPLGFRLVQIFKGEVWQIDEVGPITIHAFLSRGWTLHSKVQGP